MQQVEDAEEVTQDVFVKIHRSASGFNGKSKVETWIYRITINTALNALSKRKRQATYFAVQSNEQLDLPDFEHPGVKLENQEKAKFLFWAINQLPETQKTAFLLSFVEGLPRKEVADIMQLSLKAVESLLQRAKKGLRDHLGKFPIERRKTPK